MSDSFVRLPVGLIQDDRLDWQDRGVWSCLWTVADYTTRVTRPISASELVAISGVKRSRLFEALTKLADAGWLARESGKQHHANRYVLFTSPQQSAEWTTEQSAIQTSRKQTSTKRTTQTASRPESGRLPAVARSPRNGHLEPSSSPESGHLKPPVVQELDSISESTYSESKRQRVTTPRTSSGPPPNAVTEIWEYYRDHIQPMARLTDGAKRKIATRLHTWSAEELRYAIDHFAANAWRMERNARLGAEWFFRSDDQIDRFRLLEPESATRNGYSNGHAKQNGSPLSRTQPTTTEEILAARDKMRAAGYGKPRLTGTEEDGVAQRRDQPGALEALIQAQVAAQIAARQHPPEEATP